MTIISDLLNDDHKAMSAAAALEQALGNELILAVGVPKPLPPSAETLPSGDIRVVSSDLSGALGGSVSIVVVEPIARALEAVAPDEEILTMLGPIVAQTADAIRSGEEGVQAGRPHEIDAAEFVGNYPTNNEFLVYPFLDGIERVAALVVHVAPMGAPSAPSAPGEAEPMIAEMPMAAAPTVGAPMVGASAAVPPGVAATATQHQFGPLQEGVVSLVDPRPIALLADVEMGVTAELGRRRMSVRDLLALTPGAVIELDRAAGSPVDVLVNGTLIARGEVVVIDEEFGIRISEIVNETVGAR